MIDPERTTLVEELRAALVWLGGVSLSGRGDFRNQELRRIAQASIRKAIAALNGESPADGRLRCMDCRLLYEDFPLDMTLSDEQWNMIHDSPGGVLCASCIVKRASKLRGAVAVRAHIELLPLSAGETPAPPQPKKHED